MNRKDGKIVSISDEALRDYHENQMDELVKILHKLTEEQLKNGKIGRNDPCPCGSGIKAKKCCLFEGN